MEERRVDLAALEALDKAGTEAPWTAEACVDNPGAYYVSEHRGPGLRGVWTDRGTASKSDAALIAAARNALPALIALAKAVRDWRDAHGSDLKLQAVWDAAESIR